MKTSISQWGMLESLLTKAELKEAIRKMNHSKTQVDTEACFGLHWGILWI